MLAVVIAFAIAAAPPTAQGRNSALVAAESAYRALDYDKVMQLLDRARTEPTSADEYARIVELTAIMDAIYGRRERAVEGFVDLLRLNPDYVLPPRTSPKIGEAFTEAKARRAAAEEARIAEEASAAAAAVVTSLPPASPVLQVETPAAPPPAPVYQRPWFWAAIGGAAVVTATVILLTSTKAPEHDAGPFALR